jgi:hypothetical protein
METLPDVDRAADLAAFGGAHGRRILPAFAR